MRIPIGPIPTQLGDGAAEGLRGRLIVVGCATILFGL